MRNPVAGAVCLSFQSRQAAMEATRRVGRVAARAPRTTAATPHWAFHGRPARVALRPPAQGPASDKALRAPCGGKSRGVGATFPAFPNTQETRQLLQKYGGKFDYDVDLEHVEGTGLDSISALASLL